MKNITIVLIVVMLVQQILSYRGYDLDDDDDDDYGFVAERRQPMRVRYHGYGRPRRVVNYRKFLSQ